MKTFLKKCSFDFFTIFTCLMILLFLLLSIDRLINAENNCIKYATFIESDYKFDSSYGCYVKRNNIWISKSESEFR